jgi:hypothetical protein
MQQNISLGCFWMQMDGADYQWNQFLEKIFKLALIYYMKST